MRRAQAGLSRRATQAPVAGPGLHAPGPHAPGPHARDLRAPGLPDVELRSRLRSTLHDLAQPLCALECRLYLGILAMDGGQPAEQERDDLREAIKEAHRECSQLMDGFRALQEELRRAAVPG